MTRRLIAILLMLWFPVQGWASFTMPFCQHASKAVKAAEMRSPAVVEVSDHCLHHGEGTSTANAQSVAALTAEPAADSPIQAAQCDHCAACHLAHTPMLTLLPLNLACAAPAQRAHNAAVFYYQLFPEQPQRPPLPLV